MRKPEPHDLKPCPHMRILVSAWIDDALTGLARWYTAWHVAHCPQCAASLPFLQGLRDRMRDLESAGGDVHLPPERWATVEEGWEQMEREQAASAANS